MKTTRRVKCQEPTCSEWANYTYDTRAEAREADLRRVKYPWKCGEHSDPARNLSMERLEVSKTFTNKNVMFRETDQVLGMFFDGHFGLMTGNGFRAKANDFPEGAKLIITARIELP